MVQEKIITLMNQERGKGGKEALTLNSYLSRAAQNKNHDMEKGNYFQHSTPGGKLITDFIPKEYPYMVVGENLAFGFSDEESLVRAWMKSPLHRANILDKEFRETGLDIHAVQGKFLITQVFAQSQENFLKLKTESAKEPMSGSFGSFQHPYFSIFFFFALMMFMGLLWMAARSLQKSR